jgi:3-oxoacyl-[acyl-carrier-protein] synthase II
MTDKKVVITGLGTVSPLGANTKDSWDNLIAKKSGVKKITHFDTSDIASKIAALVNKGDKKGQFNPDNFLSVKEQRKTSDFIIYAIAAADEAIKDSGIDLSSDSILRDTGVLVGSGIGGLNEIYKTSITLHEKGARRVSPFFIPSSLINLASGHISILNGFRGPNHSVVTACATGTHAIGDAARLIKHGDAKIMVCGGTEAAISRISMAGFSAARALTSNFNDDPEKSSRPWDQDRDGFTIGEGAGILVLEDYEHAKARNANIYGEILGYGLSGDAHHITSPPEDGRGAYSAMTSALKDAELNPSDIDYINAHGTSTPVGDKVELNTVTRLFEDRKKTLSMSSTKSSIGHLLGAAGSVEAIFSTLAIKNNIRPATLNLDNPIEDCKLNLVANNPQEGKTNIVLSNSFGFGGTNASLIIKGI